MALQVPSMEATAGSLPFAHGAESGAQNKEKGVDQMLRKLWESKAGKTAIALVTGAAVVVGGIFVANEAGIFRPKTEAVQPPNGGDQGGVVDEPTEAQITKKIVSTGFDPETEEGRKAMSKAQEEVNNLDGIYKLEGVVYNANMNKYAAVAVNQDKSVDINNIRQYIYFTLE